MADSLTGRSRDFGALWRAWWEEQRGGGKVAARPPDSVPMDVRGGAPRGRPRGAPRGTTAVDAAGGQATGCPRPRSAGVVTAVASAGHLRQGDAEPHSRFSNPRAQSLPATDLSSSASFHLYAGSRMTVSGSWPKRGGPVCCRGVARLYGMPAKDDSVSPAGPPSLCQSDAPCGSSTSASPSPTPQSWWQMSARAAPSPGGPSGAGGEAGEVQQGMLPRGAASPQGVHCSEPPPRASPSRGPPPIDQEQMRELPAGKGVVEHIVALLL